jgi:hypothetical protein
MNHIICEKTAQEKYQPLHNFIRDVLLWHEFTAREIKIVLAILAVTIGYGRLSSPIPLFMFERMTGLFPNDIYTTLKKLQKRQLILTVGRGKNKIFSVNFQLFLELDQLRLAQVGQRYASTEMLAKRYVSDLISSKTLLKNSSESLLKNSSKLLPKKPEKTNDSDILNASLNRILNRIQNNLSLIQKEKLKKRWASLSEYKQKREAEIFNSILKDHPNDFDLVLEVLERLEERGADYRGNKILTSVYSLLKPDFWMSLKTSHLAEKQQKRSNRDQQERASQKKANEEVEKAEHAQVERLREEFETLFQDQKSRTNELTRFLNPGETLGQLGMYYTLLIRWRDQKGNPPCYLTHS